MSKNFELLQKTAKEDLFAPAGLPAPARRPIPVAPSDGDAVSEEINKLVQRLFFRDGQSGGPKVVSFSGMAADTRSSWICARAGETLASQVDTSVCVVDANFLSPQLHTHFPIGNKDGSGAAPVTEGSVRNFAIPLASRNLWLMPMPTGSPNVDPYTHVERCRTLFAELREEFTYILISAPPLARQSEATLIGQLADGIVLVVAANQTRRKAALRAMQHLQAAQVNLLGTVLDQRTFPIPDFLYRKL